MVTALGDLETVKRGNVVLVGGGWAETLQRKKWGQREHHTHC